MNHIGSPFLRETFFKLLLLFLQLLVLSQLISSNNERKSEIFTVFSSEGEVLNESLRFLLTKTPVVTFMLLDGKNVLKCNCTLLNSNSNYLLKLANTDSDNQETVKFGCGCVKDSHE
jgi:hypothetical protein